MKRLSTAVAFVICLFCITLVLTAQTRYGLNFFNQSTAPTAVSVGDFWYDSAVNMLKVLTASTPVWSPVHRSVCNSAGGDTNNSSSGSGSDYAHSLTCTIASGTLAVGSIINLDAVWYINTGSSAPTILFKLKGGSAGTTVLATQTAATTPSNNFTNRTYRLSWQIYVVSTGAGGTGYTSIVSPINGFSNTNNNTNDTQPITLVTNAAQVLTMTTQWGSAGTGTNTIQLLSLYGGLVN